MVSSCTFLWDFVWVFQFWVSYPSVYSVIWKKKYILMYAWTVPLYRCKLCKDFYMSYNYKRQEQLDVGVSFELVIPEKEWKNERLKENKFWNKNFQFCVSSICLPFWIFFRNFACAFAFWILTVYLLWFVIGGYGFT